MIEVSTGCDVDRFLNQVTSHPQRYSEVTFCSPFIESRMLERLVPLFQSAPKARCTFRFITLPDSAEQIRAQLKSAVRDSHEVLIVAPRLHAKVYLAVAKRSNDSEVIVTSANFTSAGVMGNIELGVRAMPSSVPGRRLLHQVRHFVRRLAG